MLKDTFIGEIRLFGGDFAPPGWALCNGQQLPIADYGDLFALIGTTYGGEGDSFNLPDLRSRVPLHNNPGSAQLSLGYSGGEEDVVLQVGQMPTHSHNVGCSETGGSDWPAGNSWGRATANVYGIPGAQNIRMNPGMVTETGSGLAHDNQIPFLAVSYIIALEGEFPGTAVVYAYISELRIFPYSFAPTNWALCNGQSLAVNDYPDLFKAIGYTYGQEGSDFNLPNLLSRVPMHVGQGMPLGASGGELVHTLTVAEMPVHNHLATASTHSPDTHSPANAYWTANTGYRPYGPYDGERMSTAALQPAGGNDSHDNMSPYLALSVCICVSGEQLLRVPYIGEITMFACNYTPLGYEPCNGQLVPMASDLPLFMVIGYTYGGAPMGDFKLPNLQAMAAMHWGQGQGLSLYAIGDTGGEPAVTLTIEELPTHTHTPSAHLPANSVHAMTRVWSSPGEVDSGPNYYAVGYENPVQMKERLIRHTGSGQPHNNLMPYLAVNFCISIGGQLPMAPEQ